MNWKCCLNRFGGYFFNLLLLFFLVYNNNISSFGCVQFGADEQIVDNNPNDDTVQKFFEQSKGWIEHGDMRQPKVDVQLELNKLNFCKYDELQKKKSSFEICTHFNIYSRFFHRLRNG